MTRVSSLEWAAFGFPSENAIKVSIDAVSAHRAGRAGVAFTGRQMQVSSQRIERKPVHADLQRSWRRRVWEGIFRTA
jgi:hypothetical protein